MMEIEGVPLQLPEFVQEMRPHQGLAISEIVAKFRDRNVVILDAPTGAGKTIIGEAVRQVLEAKSRTRTRTIAVNVYEAEIAGRTVRRDTDLDRCMFCHQRLKGDDPLAHGYGPDCASNNQMPYSPGGNVDWRFVEVAEKRIPDPGASPERIDRCLYVCTTKSLQDQFLHDFPYANLIKGRRNYPTLDNPDLFEVRGNRHLDASDCDKTSVFVHDLPLCAGCELGPADYVLETINVEHEGERKVRHCHHCHPWQACPYEMAKNAAIRGPLAVANTAYFLTEANYVGRFGREEDDADPTFKFIIIDEADTLEQVIMGFVEVSLRKRYLKEYRLGLPEFKTKPSSWLEWTENAERVLSKIAQEASDEALRYKDKNDPIPRSLRNRIEQYERHLTTVQYARRSLLFEPENWILDPRQYDEGHLVLKPVTVGTHARSLLWYHGYKFLLMSATTISPHQVADDLGLTSEEWDYVSVDSNFPPERRPITVRPVANMTHKTKDTEWPKMARAVSDVLDLHPQDRVLVHTVSYKWTEYLEQALRSTTHRQRVLTYSDSRERESVLESYKNRPNAVLLAPSFDRGIDLPDDLCRAIIITKVPFPNLGDEQVKKRFFGTGQSGKNWYYTQTIRSIVQMTGRGMRHKSDYVASYILDSQFSSNLYATPVSRNRLPKWWVSALRWDTPRRRS